MLTTKLDRKNVTQNALIPAVLRRGTKFMQTQEEINKSKAHKPAPNHPWRSYKKS